MVVALKLVNVYTNATRQCDTLEAFATENEINILLKDLFAYRMFLYKSVIELHKFVHY